MVSLDPPYRRAIPDDADALAHLVNYAGEGLPFYLWEKMAESGETAWDVGRERARRNIGSFSYRNAVVVENADGVIACLIGYPLPNAPEPIDHDKTPRMIVPLRELENLASGTWYVNVLATGPAYRGRGHGAGLLSVVERVAHDLGKAGLSVIVSDANAGARYLYERTGYREVGRRPMVKEQWQHEGRTWVLLTKAC